jgi:hypothetical protein
MKRTLAIALCGAALVSTGAYGAEPVSPIFGKASVTLTSVDKNKSVVGKSYYADLYGYYGLAYSYYAYTYGYAAYTSASNYTKYNYYGAAANYAYYAYYYYSYASYYAYYGI